MFTWICPQCGREVPPAYTECPDCAAKTRAAAAPPEADKAPPQTEDVPPEAVPPVLPLRPPAPAPEPVKVRPYVPPPAPASHAGMPTWLMAVVFAFAFLGLGAAIYWTVGYFRGPATKPPATVENPAAKAGVPVNPFQKYMEIAGVRFVEDPKNKSKILVKFILINHSPADIQGLAGNVTVWGRTQKSEEEAAGTFAFTTNIGAFESKEMEAPLTTKLKIYELPDWQNVSTDVQITAPGSGG